MTRERNVGSFSSWRRKDPIVLPPTVCLDLLAGADLPDLVDVIDLIGPIYKR